MDLNSFAQKVRDAVEKNLGGEYRVELKEVRKNNGVVLQGLVILGDRETVVPTIYLEAFYGAYEDGVPFGEILRRIFEIYREEVPRGKIDMEFFKNFQEVKDRICYRLIRRQDNEALLAEIPHVEFLDLAICFFYAYSGRVLGEGSILIYNSHLDLWGVGMQELMSCAERNTPRLFPGKLSPMREVLQEIMNVRRLSDPEPEIPLTVLTNDRRTHGAACILYPGMLEMLAGKEKKGFYVIPSSIHEVILLEQSEGESTEALRRIIYEVNRSHVAPEEVLSDNLYFYDPLAGAMKIIF